MSSVVNPIYLGTRGTPFKTLISGLLTKGRVAPKYIQILTDEEGMKLYSQAFTASSANPAFNYEIFEQLGDLCVNQFIVWYVYRRFPQLFCPLGVKVAARLRINYGAKGNLYMIAARLKFWEYISASQEQRDTNKKDLLEDTMESFCGVTAYILDQRTRPGVGYAIVYDILKDIFDNLPMSLAYEDLYDPKTRLKETFDRFKSDIGEVKYTYEKNDNGTKALVWSVPYKGAVNKDWIFLASDNALAKKDAEKKAASKAIISLKERGYYKEPPDEYKFFCQ
jgi:dsRNA-specific ribonuclease